MKLGLRTFLIECGRLGYEEAIERLITAHDEYIEHGRTDHAARCLREAILRMIHAHDVARATARTEQLVRETNAGCDQILLGLLRERSGEALAARMAYEHASTHEGEAGLARHCLNLSVQATQLDPDDAAAYANLGQAYFEMGLLNDAIVSWLVGIRKYADQQSLNLLVEKLVSGKLTTPPQE